MSFNQFHSNRASGGDSQYQNSGNISANAAASSYQRTSTNYAKPSSGSYQRTNSYKKSNVQGGQIRGGNPLSNTAVSSQNGVTQNVPSRGVADAPISTTSTGTNAAPNINPAVPKSSLFASVTSDPKLVQTPPKTEGGPPKGFSLQFGSISPGFVNGIQIPPRTSSAPPNLDEQKQGQAQRNSPRTVPGVPLPPLSNHQLPVKEPNVVKHHPVAPLQNVKKDPLVSSPSPTSPQKPSGPVSSMSMHPSFHLPVQIGNPLQFPTQVLTSTSFQMPGIFPRGNGPLLQQPIFAPPIPHHIVQPHGIVLHGQGINFPNQSGPQLPHQMSNMGINTGHHFTPSQAGKFGIPRRAVKITHPDTHEELRLARQVKKQSPKEHQQSLSQGGAEGTDPLTATLPSDDKSPRIMEGCATATITLSEPTKVIAAASSNDLVSPDASGFSKLTISTNASSGESEELVGSSQNKVFKQVSALVNKGICEEVACKEKSYVDAEVKACEVQKGFSESMEVILPSATDIGLVKSAVIGKSGTTSDDSKPPNTVLESKSTGSLKESTSNHVDAMNISKGPNDKSPPESNMPNSSAAKGKKKMKEVLQKADAAGTTSDISTAYKRPEEKEIALSSGSGSSSVDMNQVPADTKDDTLAHKNQTNSKIEPDNWEDEEDIIAPKMSNVDKLISVLSQSNVDANEMKKYTRDFLMKFKDQCYVLPENFSIPRELLNTVVVSNMSSNGRGFAADRSNGTARSERRENFQNDDVRWINKGSASFSSRDQRVDYGYGINIARPSSGGNSSGHRHLKGQVSGGLFGPFHSLHRESAGADQWHKGTNLITSPLSPASIMHKAERKYEVGKVTDEEQVKQRQLKGILNKLTPQNFERLFEQVKAVNIDNAVTLTGVISQIFDKALMEPTFCEMYADFCHHLAEELPDFTEGNKKVTFKRVLLNKCQEEFERGEREQEEANKVEEEGEVAPSNQEREEKRVKARRRMLGNIRLIGELYKKGMLTERIMHECVKKLLGPQQNADEEDIEPLCKLMSTIGEMIDHPKAKTHMDAYFEIMLALSNNMKYSSRVRFMLKDSIDLRKNRWQQRRKVEGPKKIEEVHRDAAHERQAQSSRLTRGPSMNASTRRGSSTDFGPRGLSLLPNSQIGEYRNFPSQARGFSGTQDVRMVDRLTSYENRNVAVPLPQRGTGSDTVTLGPQGGVSRGMPMRGAPSAHVTPLYRGLSGNMPATERPAYNPNNNGRPVSSSGPLIGSADSQPAGLEPNTSMENEIRNLGRDADRPVAIDPAHQNQTLPEERLRHMSTATIKEFYSAKDEKEVALCIKDMNTPSFYPSMIALWVSDSFERKDMERNMLSRLLVNLTKAEDNNLYQNDLIDGFESVLTTLEDAVNDAPRAPEFLGCILARVVMENVIPVGVVGDMVHKGGEEPGSLVESGVAGDVIGNLLEAIQLEKGDSYLNEIRSRLELEDFRPPHPLKSRKLEKFL